MRRYAIIGLILTLSAGLPGLAAAQQLFDFNGQADVPEQVGHSLTLVSRVYDPSPGEAPLPLDFEHYEYTLVVQDLVLAYDGRTQMYTNGRISLYRDAGSPSNYMDGGTFTDGSVVLSGELGIFYRTMFPEFGLGSGRGTVDWTGGSELNEFAPQDQDEWPFLTGISRRARQVLGDYDENWDGKVEPRTPVVPNSRATWSGIKALYR